jgi:hypothetical protein
MKVLAWLLLIVIAAVVVAYAAWPHLINAMLPADSRPKQVMFPVDTITAEEFERIAQDLTDRYDEEFVHIENFREAEILEYRGPETCLGCHEEIEIESTTTGETMTVDLMENLLGSAHYRFFTTEHPNVYGFNGELADHFPMGKIDRPCPKPGSFAMTAWAEIAVNAYGDTLSEGCGQCHIGGQVQAPLGEMMPGYRTLAVEKDAIDCLICHSVGYDMNQKIVIVDEEGQKHWGQDRSMRAAMSVTRPTAPACLRCHQHNFGGDLYIDSADSSYMESLLNLGERPRVLHPGSKRGTPYSPSWDVHAAAGLACIDCHVTEGHLIAKGTHTTTMMANDLPHVELPCQDCHTDMPHERGGERAAWLNMHAEYVACQTCHIPSLHPDNATMRDFGNTVYEEHEGIHIYNDIEKETEPGSGIVYVWWNGDATFLGNPIGDNPNGENLYRFYQPTHVWPEFRDFDYEGWYEDVMRPIAQRKPSKLYAMKRFNGRQHIDLQNMGPFGGMYVPYNLPAYYASGDPDKATRAEMQKSMMGMMYGPMFKYYMMDKFMTFMNVDTWDTAAYSDVARGEKIEPRWIPNDACLEISHSIRREGALSCEDCHSPDGVLDWQALGYSEDDAAAYSENPLAD